MEESAKRRERLQAMRLEASRPPSPSSPFSSSPASALTPPVLPLPYLADPRVVDTPPPVPRFDFYTDPTSAFSAHKRLRGTPTAGCSPSFPNRPPPPRPSFPTGIRSSHVDSSYYPSGSHFHPPDSGFYSAPSCFPHNSPWRNPSQLPTPFPRHQGSPAGVPGSPGSVPGSWNRSGGSPRPALPLYSPSNDLTSPHFGRGQGPMDYAGSSSPHSVSERGRGQQFRGGRGRGFNNKVPAQPDIASYFSPSMLEDPWENLQPVVGNILEPKAGPGYWFPESLAQTESLARNKSKVSETKCSLAESLASSLHGAINEED